VRQAPLALAVELGAAHRAGWATARVASVAAPGIAPDRIQGYV
jgi:hypothetical protein